MSFFPPPGQFRDGCPPDIKVDEVLAQGQLLAAHTDAFVHLYEMSVVTGGEVIVELTNSQMGMGALHSVIPTSGAIMAAVLACVEAKGWCVCVEVVTSLPVIHSLALKNDGRGLGLWPCVSLYLPGTMAMCVTVCTWDYGHVCHCIYLGLWPCVSLYLPGTMAMCVTVFTWDYGHECHCIYLFHLLPCARQQLMLDHHG